jgi:hypothetical protein
VGCCCCCCCCCCCRHRCRALVRAAGRRAAPAPLPGAGGGGGGRPALRRAPDGRQAGHRRRADHRDRRLGRVCHDGSRQQGAPPPHLHLLPPLFCCCCCCCRRCCCCHCRGYCGRRPTNPHSLENQAWRVQFKPRCARPAAPPTSPTPPTPPPTPTQPSLQVLVGAHAVLANGGVIAPSGVHMVALAAKRHSIPLVVLVGLHKLSPQVGGRARPLGGTGHAQAYGLLDARAASCSPHVLTGLLASPPLSLLLLPPLPPPPACSPWHCCSARSCGGGRRRWPPPLSQPPGRTAVPTRPGRDAQRLQVARLGRGLRRAGGVLRCGG